MREGGDGSTQRGGDGRWPGQAVAASTPSSRPRAASSYQGHCKLLASRARRRCTLRQAASTWLGCKQAIGRSDMLLDCICLAS
ncbi:hypothetical protein DAI22_07g142400 [Oryza sativa Japonica Group]|uniref:Uncharacterized protein n=1 Tax=Oryza sativa subsp. japonica TaxID=39947 RepID=Q8H2Q2_ORYSJ|nr:hypothetical protein DAI22_07g142400 [Oryza sativa Japonica Group]BAC16179.1 hypothetical protein [Oryza sativa Japonica Group]